LRTRPAASRAPAGPALPEGRYGSSHTGGEPRRWRIWVFGTLGLVVGAVVAYVGYVNLGSTPIDAQRLGFEDRPGDSMAVTIDVTREDPGRPGVCIVRVRDITGAESGRKEVLVRPGGGDTRLTTVVRSIGRPVTADVFGCSYDVPSYLSSP
jgi:hypothetical protein